MNRRSYKGVDDYGSVVNVGDGYYNDAYEDEESKNTMKRNNNIVGLFFTFIKIIRLNFIMIFINSYSWR